ncbi:MAG: hypothetical protein ACJA1H_002433 [Glaciecola sp.]|jgi:hypothetical protein
MKIFIKLCLVALLFTACEETESATFDPSSGQTGIGFADSVIDFSVPVDGVTISVAVFSTTVSSQDRTFSVTADVDESNVTASDYSLGSVSIPANSHEGNLDVTFNYDGLEDFEQNILVVNVEPADGATVFSPLTFTFLREFDINEFVCSSDYQLVINLDNYSSENTWELLDSTGTTLYTGGPYADGRRGETETVNGIALAAGCYTFTFFDSYGDGLFDGVVEGDYSLHCAAQTVVSYASGVGNFGASNSTDFCVN